MYEFLDALLTCQTAPEEVQSRCCHTTSLLKFVECTLKPERFILLVFVSPQAFRKFDEMSGKLTEQLRKLAKQVVAALCFFTLRLRLSALRPGQGDRLRVTVVVRVRPLAGPGCPAGARRRPPEESSAGVRLDAGEVSRPSCSQVLAAKLLPRRAPCDALCPQPPVAAQVHCGADGPGQDLLEPGELQHGGEDLPQVGGGVQRGRHMEAERGPRPLHAEQVQGGHWPVRAHCQEALRRREYGGTPLAEGES